MQTTITNKAQGPSKATLWTGRIIMGICVLFLLFDAVTKIFPNQYVLDASAKIGWTINTLRPLGIVLLLSTILYAIPRTTIFGAILVTAWMGGATASNILAGYNFIFPIIFGILVWTGLGLTHSHHRNAILSKFR
ncbi:MAG TPA: DoxX family protein [Puia sp.]|nr:DoxX family protein [Puia sp.]